MNNRRKLIVLSGALIVLAFAGAVFAAPSSYIKFVQVNVSNCIKRGVVAYLVERSVTADESSVIHATITNLRTKSMISFDENIDAEKLYPGKGKFSFAVHVPQGTQEGDRMEGTITIDLSGGGQSTDSKEFTCGGSNGSGDSEGRPFDPGDARLNHYDAGASYAVYCQTNGDISVWAIAKDGHAFESFAATAAEIAAAGATPASATAIDSGAGGDGGVITLYRRPDGYFQLNGPALAPNNLSKTYTVSFNGCPGTDVQTTES